VQNIQRFPWDLNRVNGELEEIMVRAYRQVGAMVEKDKITYRDAAFSIAVGRVVQALELQGLP
jgi:glutamate dehydrogenase/leucine dehydrogenase